MPVYILIVNRTGRKYFPLSWDFHSPERYKWAVHLSYIPGNNQSVLDYSVPHCPPLTFPLSKGINLPQNVPSNCLLSFPSTLPARVKLEYLTGSIILQKLTIEYLSEEVYEEYAHEIHDMYYFLSKYPCSYNVRIELMLTSLAESRPSLVSWVHRISVRLRMLCRIRDTLLFIMSRTCLWAFALAICFRKLLIKKSFDAPIYLELEEVKLPNGILFYVQGEWWG